MSRDLTAQQRNVSYLIRKEFRSRRENGGSKNNFCKKCLTIQRTHTVQNLNIAYQNVRGLNTKFSTFYPNIVDCDFDVILLVETWLRDDVLSSEYFSPNYSVHRSYNGRRGRGLATAVLIQYSSEMIVNKSPIDDIDLLIVRVKVKEQWLNFINIYFPPETNNLL